MDVVVIGVLGLLVGSFLNVVIYRLPRGESLVRPASRCPSAARRSSPTTTSRWSRGCCCAGAAATAAPRISARYPLVEVLTAAVFVGDGARARRRRRPRALAAVRGHADRRGRDRPRPPDHPEQDRAAGGDLGARGARSLFRPDNIDDSLIAGGDRVLCAAPGRAGLSGGHGDGRREARGRDGDLPRLGGRPGDARRPSWRARSWGSRSSRARARTPARRASRSGRSWRSAASSASTAGPELVDAYVDRFL